MKQDKEAEFIQQMTMIIGLEHDHLSFKDVLAVAKTIVEFINSAQEEMEEK